MEDFHAQTEEKNNHACFLFLDSHKSHCTLAAMDFSVLHNIIVVSYLPHSTQVLQGSDRACFGAVKVYWAQVKNQWENEKHKTASKDNFLLLYS